MVGRRPHVKVRACRCPPAAGRGQPPRQGAQCSRPVDARRARSARL